MSQKLNELKEKAKAYNDIIKNIISYGDNDPTTQSENNVSETEDYKASLAHWQNELKTILMEIKELEPTYNAISV